VRGLGFHQVLEPAEVGGDELLKLAAQQPRDQPERAAGVARIDWVRILAAPSPVRRYSSWKRTGPATPWPTRRPGGSYPVTSYGDRTVAGPARAVIT
jgi:hypothetical protein